MKFGSTVLNILIVALLVWCVSGCSNTATIHRYGAPSLESEIVASDTQTLVVQDEHGDTYEVPVLTVTEVDHPGTGWIVAGGILAGMGVLFAFAADEAGSDIIGGTYIGMGFGVGLIGAFPHVRSRMNTSGADLRSGVRLVPGTDMPVRRIDERQLPRGPERRP
jgi:hypothetical protein